MKILKYSKWPYCQRNIQSNTFRGESGQQICDTIFQIRACFAKNTTSQHKVQLKAKILQYLFKYNRNFQLQMASKFTKRTRKTKQVISIASSRFGYFRPQTKICGWAYKIAHNIWNFVPNLKMDEKRRKLIEVRVTT